MFPWKFVCIAAVALGIVLAVKIAFLYQGLKEIGRQLHDRLSEDTNNVIYVSGNDRHLKAFARQVNQELKILYDQRRRYQNGDRELKEAVTNISHDLRTPLTAIYGYLELADAETETAEALEAAVSLHGLGDNVPVERNRKESLVSAIPVSERGSASLHMQYIGQMAHYLSQIRNRADAMRALTEELFRYSIIVSASRDDMGYQQAAGGTGAAPGKERVVLNRFLADCLLSYYDIFRQNGIEPQIVIADEEVVRVLDAGALRRIFCNILDNAVKYSKPAMSSERAVLSVELFPDGTITFRNSAQNLDWVFVERLFDRFYTVETGRNATGLGLSIAKLLTERMGGSISAAHAEGMLEIMVKL